MKLKLEELKQIIKEESGFVSDTMEKAHREAMKARHALVELDAILRHAPDTDVVMIKRVQQMIDRLERIVDDLA